MPQVLADCFQLLLHKADAIADPFEQAFFLMVQLPYLQPFEDVHKRVSRLGANIPLIRHNLCPLSFIDVPDRAYTEGTLGVYELNDVALLRDVFVWAYERSCQRYLAITQALVAPDPLKIRYRQALIEAVRTVVKGLRRPTPDLISSRRWRKRMRRRPTRPHLPNCSRMPSPSCTNAAWPATGCGVPNFRRGRLAGGPARNERAASSPGRPDARCAQAITPMSEASSVGWVVVPISATCTAATPPRPSAS